MTKGVIKVETLRKGAYLKICQLSCI